MIGNVVITGSTGIIGRHVLYEYLDRIVNGGEQGTLYLPVRSSDRVRAVDRIRAIVRHEDRPESLAAVSEEQWASSIRVWDLSAGGPNDFARFLSAQGVKNAVFLHLASSTNLSTLAEVEEEIYRESYLPTFEWLNACMDSIEHFVLVSTAFSSGHRAQKIENEYLRLDRFRHRNYYEAFKNRAERRVREVCETNGKSWQVLRPSIVCGRLLDKPLFYTPKFNVFYAWAALFATLVGKNIDCNGMRIAADPQGSLNIVACDYVAKAIVAAVEHRSVKELNIVSTRSFSNEKLVSGLLRSVGVDRFQYVDRVPTERLSRPEKVYYGTAGLQFTPYLVTPHHHFDTSVLRSLLNDCPEPSIDDHFSNLVEYAKDRRFVGESA